MNALGNRLQRLNTNESSSSSIFSRNPSSSSMSTVYSPNNGVSIPQSLSLTRMSDQHTDGKLDPNHTSFNIGDALERALTQVPANNQGQPKTSNRLTTTPTSEPLICSKWCIILVGLPASGKSSISKNLIKHTIDHFTNTVGVNFKINSFNAGNFRRKLSDFKTQTSNYFDFTNQEAKNQREKFAHIALDHLLNSLVNSQIDVGIFDATNSTRERRENILSAIKEKEAKTGVQINTVILHVKCTDQLCWKYNVEGKTSGPDYVNLNHDVAISDFVRRAELYQRAFQDITKEELEMNKGLVCMEIDNCGKNLKIDENNFQYKDDLIFQELKKFVEEYYNTYGLSYEDKVSRFWASRKQFINTV